MDKKHVLILSFISLFAFTSCNNRPAEPEPDDPDVPPVVKYDSLDKVIDNTSRYTLRNDNGTDDGYIIQIVDDNLFYYACEMGGYILDSNDPSYFHLFDTSFSEDDGHSEIIMSVGGRSFHKDLYDLRISSLTFTSIIDEYQDYFFPEEDNFYVCETYEVVRTFSDFFQLSGMRYCNYIELTISPENRLDTIKFYEKYDEEKINTYSYIIQESNIQDVSFYQKWVSEGKQFKERIFDIKQKDVTNNKLSVYEGATLTLEDCVIVGKSANNPNTYYIAQDDDLTGPVGIKVNLQSSQSFTKLDLVNVVGTVTTIDNCVVLNNATVTKKGTVHYAPRYSEEVIGNNYGGGVFAYEIFSSADIYDGSLYTTFGKLTSIPTSFSSIEDTTIEIAFPDIYTSVATYYLNLILPKDLSSSLKETILSNLSELTAYDEGGIPGDYIMIENVIVDYETVDNDTKVTLVCTEDTSIYKKYEPRELIEAIYPTLKDIPLPSEAVGEIAYKCGEDSGINIEDNYNISVKYGTKGIFYGCQLEEEDYKTYLDELINYGCIKYDEIKDYSGSRHVIFTKGRYVIDVEYVSNWSGSAMYMWIYRSDEVFRTPNILEKLEEKIGSFFDVNNFLKLTGTYDADYTLYELYSYAGIDLTENPLTCVTIDLNENKYTEYITALVQQLNYTQYRVDNKVAYYTVRGATHQGFMKDGVYLDIALYETTDYTYYGHDSWTYRIEILIYEGNQPIDVPTYTSLDPLSDLYKEVKEEAAYSITLPEGSKVEVWKRMPYGYWSVGYGFNSRNEAFIYSSDLTAVITAVRNGLEESGYVLQKAYSRGWLYYKTTSTGQYPVYILNESSKGYIRVMNDIGGVSFLQ